MSLQEFLDRGRQRVAEMVATMSRRPRQTLSPDESTVGVYLRANPRLHEAMRGIIQSRIAGRATVPEPSDPLACKSMISRDRECQWLLWRLDILAKGEETQEEEQPA